jgi:hypothetical protein
MPYAKFHDFDISDTSNGAIDVKAGLEVLIELDGDVWVKISSRTHSAASKI